MRRRLRRLVCRAFGRHLKPIPITTYGHEMAGALPLWWSTTGGWMCGWCGATIPHRTEGST